MRSIILLIVGGILTALVAGCATSNLRQVPTADSTEISAAKELLQKQKEDNQPSAPAFTEKLEPLTKDLQKEPQLYSLVFQEAPVGDVLTALTKDSSLNLIVENGVELTKPVTVNLKNVTLKEALDMAVTRCAGFSWTLQDNFLHIKKFEERVYHFDYLDMVGDANIEVGGDMLASSVENSGVSGKFQIKAKRSVENSDVWTSIQTSLEGLKSEGGTLRINRSSGVIFISDTPQRVSCMVKFLDSLSEALHREVFLEAKIVEVRLSDNSKYGIDWSKFEINFSSGKGFVPDQFNLSVNGGGAVTLSDTTKFSAVLDFLRTQGDVSVLSNPHLLVMNGQSALMTVGYQYPYGDISGITRDQVSDTVTVDATIKRAILGLQIGITARIGEDGMITLNIVPTVTRIQSEQKVELPTSSTTVQSISNPIIDLQELATTVRIKEGRSVVLAGLISQTSQLEHEGLPVLGSLPIIGSLFKHAGETKEVRELVIFITPKIIRQD